MQQVAMDYPVTVRTAQASDEHALGRLGALLVEEHYEFDPLRFVKPTADLAGRYGQFLLSQSRRADMFVLVAERERSVVGYAYAGVEGTDYMALRGPAGLLYDLVVDPDHRRQGIGTALMEAALAELARRGSPRAVLFTAEKNQGAQALFSANRFRRTMIEMTREL